MPKATAPRPEMSALLRGVSRSFYVSIRLLPAQLRQPVSVAYLLARATDTVADSARLEIIATPGAGWCMQCEGTVALAQLYGACPQCGTHQVQVTGGTELRVKELEVE